MSQAAPRSASRTLPAPEEWSRGWAARRWAPVSPPWLGMGLLGAELWFPPLGLLSPHSGRACLCRVDWRGPDAESLLCLGALDVVLMLKRMLIGNEPVGTSPTAFSGPWCVRRCVWGL